MLRITVTNSVVIFLGLALDAGADKWQFHHAIFSSMTFPILSPSSRQSAATKVNTNRCFYPAGAVIAMLSIADVK
jgi:hypothetical protein